MFENQYDSTNGDLPMKLKLPDFKYGLGILLNTLAISPQIAFALNDPDLAIKIQALLSTFGVVLPPGIVQAIILFVGSILLK